MFSAKLHRWFKHLLFGDRDYRVAPKEAAPFIADLEKRGIRVHTLIRNGGGLVSLPLRMVRDLDLILRHYPTSDPPLSTPQVVRFYNEWRLLLASSSSCNDDEPESSTDQETLQQILNRPDKDHYHYRDADFWGRLATRLLHHHRPPGTFSVIDNVPMQYLRHAQRLYDVTVKRLGKLVDPFTMVMVPANEYIDPIYWRNTEGLDRFLEEHPSHPFAKTIRSRTSRLADRLLNAEPIPDDPRLDQISRNIEIVHREIRKVDGFDRPPKLVDVFHRLLALTNMDHLWSPVTLAKNEAEEVSSSQLRLYEKIHQLEKELALWKKLVAAAANNNCST